MEVANLTHSHSQPGEMDRTPPGTPKKGGKMLAVRVQMLDDTVTMFQIQAKALGRVLFEQVCNQLNLLESDYFGLEYQETGGTKYWLDLEKPVCRQIGLSLIDTLVRFCVKFYTPDPSQLEEEFTRYLFCLQIKRDLSQGLLLCNSNTAALMASYIVQAECGDYVAEDYPDHRYLSSYKFVPNQDQELERRIMENHKKHAGQSPAEADLNLLETARRCELYGIKMHPAKDHEGCPLNLAVAHMGIVVFQNFSKINTFSWAKIRKISFKRKRFLVKLHPEGYGYYKDTVEFFFEGRNECKNFWKKCVENHGFFRCTMVKKVPRQKTRVLSRGSSFRYSGRTQKQIVDFVRENYVKRQTFQRSQSFRHSSSAHSSVANVGTSISAHPLLPLGDNAVAGTPASLSCGSMTLTSSPVHTADIHAGGSPSPPLTTSVSPGTSVTSSPQHVYPQETPYRRTGHRPSKVKRPPMRSHHAISPLLSPTDAATAAGNRSANRSNNVALDPRDVIASRNSLTSPEFIHFNHVYSNCYTSLRSLGNDLDDDIIIHDKTKTDIFRLAGDFVNGAAGNGDSEGTLARESKDVLSGNDGEDADRYTWHRSASCKDLYREDSLEREKREAESFGGDRCRRKCYSAVSSKNPSMERAGEGAEVRIYSSSYPGTTSSLSTESAEGELEERVAEVLDVKYDSQEEMGLSHDDVSHDSYELLERELEERGSGLGKHRGGSRTSEGERTRSCSWGSDRGVSLVDIRSSEGGIGSGMDGPREQNFWSLEREKSGKHKSESDFRSLGSVGRGNCYLGTEAEERYGDGRERLGRTGGDLVERENRSNKRSKEGLEESELEMIRKKDLEGLLGSAKVGIGEERYEILERHRYHNRWKSVEECGNCLGDAMEMNKEASVRMEERKRMERRREKKEREERFHEGFKEKEEKEWGRERERRQVNRRKSMEERELREEEEGGRKTGGKLKEYGDFQEIQLKKFERVVSNQFGRYSEFLTQEKSFFAQEKKVMENYEKMYQVSRLVKELKTSSPGNLAADNCVENMDRKKKVVDSMEFEEWKGSALEHSGLTSSPRGGYRVARAVVERTKSDPYNSLRSQKRNILMHQKSIDLTPQQSEETTSDYDNENGLKKTSRSEHDIPYILHKRHCMNGTAKNADFVVTKTDLRASAACRGGTVPESPAKIAKVEPKKSSRDVSAPFRQRPSSAKVAEAKRAGVQIINLDVSNGRTLFNIGESKRLGKSLKSPTGKRPSSEDGKVAAAKTPARKEASRAMDVALSEKCAKGREETSSRQRQKEEPIYAEVCREKVPSSEDSLSQEDKVPPQPPKRSSSCPQKGAGEDSGRTKVDGGAGSGVQRRREESQTLFARTRLGVSEGSAFAAMVRERGGGGGSGGAGSPMCQRRTKSLDAPYVSVHRLPAADAFSSKDDTVEGSEGDIVNSAVSRFLDLRRGDGKRDGDGKSGEREGASDVAGNTESEVDSVFTDDLDLDKSFKKAVVSQSKVEISFGDEKVLDGVRGKRLLSKIESVDLIDSEGDLDSSKVAEPPAIPSDRLVNLPESIRFPSVRQISGQTSEESADGWDQKEVKVKRRTPRRSLGREEQEIPGESVVWDSKDEEPPEDDVWDDKVPPSGKYEGVVVNVGLPSEYLKRGSCGQSIDDDNLSTPMKESSPEHWVSVDDLPEALEREEKLLRQQERILREKILNEKLKRELNLDTIDVDERFCDYKDSVRQLKYEEETMSLKENLKGHSLDTYELNEKKSRERRGNKNSTSLDEDLLPNKLIHTLDAKEKASRRTPLYGEEPDYVECKVVKDVTEIEDFADNDEELEEFFVVLDENLGKEGRDMIWGDESSLRRTLSNDESLISVPEEFKDVEGECSEEGRAGGEVGGGVEIRLSEAGGRGEEMWVGRRGSGRGEEVSEEVRSGGAGDVGGLSPRDGGRGGSEENRKLSLSEDTGRLSPYESSSRRGSDEPRKLSSSDDAGRLSPFTDSRRGSEDPRRLSTSEDSRKCSVSESVSEETRRRLSSTEETRRKRASLTKQCSVGADSLSDEIISGIQECSSSFEHDEKDVFEPEPAAPRHEEIHVDGIPCEGDSMAEGVGDGGTKTVEGEAKVKGAIHLAPPSSERELSRETEDSVDYAEGDLKDMRDVVKEKEMSEDLVSEGEPVKSEPGKLASSLEKSGSSENDDFRYIDEKRGSTPEIIVGKSREAVAMSIVVVNEGISVLNKINEGSRRVDRDIEAQPLPRIPVSGPAFPEQRHAPPKTGSKPKPLTPKPLDYAQRKAMKTAPEIKVKTSASPVGKEPTALMRSSLDSSQESDLDRLSDISLVSHVQNEILRRNLSEAGKCLRRDDVGAVLSGDSGSWKTSSEDDALPGNQKTSSEEKERTDHSSAEEEVRRRDLRVERVGGLRAVDGKLEGSRGTKEGGGYVLGREKRSPEQEKRDSGEDGSSSSSAPVCPKRELSSTWKPFLLESSGSSSLEEGWLPPDENAHLADEEETSSTSNNQQDDSCHDDVDYPTGIGYPVLNVSTAEMMVGGYGSVYALSRTLSRISERSISEQERSDLEDDITKPSTHSMSVEEESILSSDHQPSLSSDPPSPKGGGSVIPDLPVDRPIPQCEGSEDEGVPACEPFGDVIPPPVPEEDWPSPPSSSSVMDTPVVSHIETFYMEIHPEEAYKIVVAGSRDEGNSSSDENQTLHEESEFMLLSSDNMSASTTTTTQDGTVIIPVRPKPGNRGSLTEDVSVLSSSERSAACCAPDDGGPEGQDRQPRSTDESQGDISHRSAPPSKYCPEHDSQKSKVSNRAIPPRLSSPTAKTFGFFETPVSKVRSPTSQFKFFDAGDRGASPYSNLRSPTSFSETTSPKTYKRFFDGSVSQHIAKSEPSDRRTPRSPTNHSAAAPTPYYSTVADCAEKSYFGRYDTGSLERTKIHSSRKCSSYYFVCKPALNENYGSPSDAPPAPEPNTIPRASKKTAKRHRVAMDLVVRDGRIVAPPKTNATVLDNSDSDRSSPRNLRPRHSPKTHSDV